MERTGRRIYPVWCGASPQRRELPAHCELALRNPGGDCGRVLRLDVEEDRLDLSRRAAPRRRGHLLALLLSCGLSKGATAITRSALTDPLGFVYTACIYILGRSHRWLPRACSSPDTARP